MTTINMGLLIQSKALQSKLFEKANQVSIVEGRHADHNQQLSIITHRGKTMMKRNCYNYFKYASQWLI